ncbi:MAG: hypothetical protein Q4F97_12745 [Bacteroidales bacterium]|nr:hypothetical protein [Bacteroidales bacterium]
MKKTIFIFLALIGVYGLASSQSHHGIIMIDNDTTHIAYKWMGTTSRTLTDKMKLIYQKPKNFKEIGAYECFKEYPKLELTFSCMGPQLHSKDGQFISFLVFPDIYTKEFQESLNWLSAGNRNEDWVDKQHYRQMIGIIKMYYGEIGSSMNELIQLYPTEEAAAKFNADSAFYFSLILNPDDYYKEVYKYVKVLVLQKKDRGYAYICSFYTDKAKKQLNKYWCRIEKTLHYED